MKKCFLIVGFGSIGQRHFNNLKKLAPELDVVLLRSSKHSSNITSSVEGVLKVIDSLDEIKGLEVLGAIIATPASLHLGVVAKLTQLKIPVLVEKPLCVELAEASAFQATLFEHTPPVLLVGYNFRFSKAANKLKESVDSGAIGKPLTASIEMGFFLPEWRPHQDYRYGVSAQKKLGGGALLELSHALDLYLWFFGLPATVVGNLTKLSDLEIDVEDCVDLILQSSQGLVATIHLDMLQRKVSRKFKIVGSEGTLVWDMVENSIELSKVGLQQNLSGMEVGMGGESWNDMYLQELQHFLDCILRGVEPRVSLEDGVNVMKMVAAARRSSQTKSMVRLEGELQ